MAFQILCQLCNHATWAGNIVDLIERCTDPDGRLVCEACGQTTTYIQWITGRWEKEPDEAWTEVIKGVRRFPASDPTRVAYAFLTADGPDAPVSAVRFSYYSNPGPKGWLRDGPGPGAAPRLTLSDVAALQRALGAFQETSPAVRELVAAA